MIFKPQMKKCSIIPQCCQSRVCVQFYHSAPIQGYVFNYTTVLPVKHVCSVIPQCCQSRVCAQLYHSAASQWYDNYCVQLYLSATNQGYVFNYTSVMPSKWGPLWGHTIHYVFVRLPIIDLKYHF